jgi:hypothetical protein
VNPGSPQNMRPLKNDESEFRDTERNSLRRLSDIADPFIQARASLVIG